MYYQTLPNLTEYNQQELSNSFIQSQFNKKPETERVAKPFSISISKQDVDAIMSDGNLTSGVITFFIHYVKNACLLFKIERPADILAFKITNFHKYEKKVAYEYLETLKNDYKDYDAEIVKKGLTLFLVFFHDGRWILAIYDPKKEKIMICDFLARSLSKVSREEVYDLVKAYLSEEFEFNSSSVTYYEKYRSETYNNCGLFVCKFLAEYFMESVDYNNINVVEKEKEEFKKVLTWLIMKVDQLKRPHDKDNSVFNKSLNKSLDKRSVIEPIRPSPIRSKPASLTKINIPNPSRRVSQQPIMQYGPDEIKEDNNKIKLTRDELAKMLDKVKDEAIKEIEDSESEVSVSQILEDEGLFEDSLSKAEISKSRIKKLIYKINKKNRKRDKSPGYQSSRTTEEDERLKMAQYNQEVQEFYGMLNYFQTFNSDLYTKVARDLNSQVEDKLLEKYNLLHVKYPTLKPQKLPNIFSPKHSPSVNDLRSSIGNSNLRDSNHIHFNVSPRQSIMKKPAILEPRKSIFEPKKSIFEPPGAHHSHHPSHHHSPHHSPGLPTHKNKGSLDQGAFKFSQKAPLQLDPLTPTSDSIRTSRPGNLLDGNSDQPFSPFGVGKGETNPKNQILAKRYGIKVSRYDFQKIKLENILPVHVLNFFLGYLREKQTQMPANKLKNFEGNILYLGPEFYQTLTDDTPFMKPANFEKVKNWTSPFTGSGKTIFDVLDKVVLILKERNEHYMLVCINNKDSKVYLFDPVKPKENTPSENSVLLNVLQFMDFEYQDKAQKRVEMSRWQLVYGDMTRAYDLRESALVIAKVAHNIQKGSIHGKFKEDQLFQFKSDLLDLILRIGISNDRDSDMKWVVNHKL